MLELQCIMYYIVKNNPKKVGAVEILEVYHEGYPSNGISHRVAKNSELEKYLDYSFAGKGNKYWMEKTKIEYTLKKGDLFTEEKDELDERIEKMWATPSTQEQRDAAWSKAKQHPDHQDFKRWVEGK